MSSKSDKAIQETSLETTIKGLFGSGMMLIAIYQSVNAIIAGTVLIIAGVALTYLKYYSRPACKK